MHRLLVLAVLLLAFWLRTADLDRFPKGLSNDEATSVIDAFHIVHAGNFPLYEDHGRPEPLDRFIMAAGSILYSDSIWAYRITNVFAGLVTIAAIYWVMLESLHDLPSTTRRAAALAAAAALAVAISHITLSRAIYRAIFQPPFMLLFLGLLLRGLRTHHRRYFIGSAVSLALSLYSYTSALAVPAALAPLALSLLIFRRRTWRVWFPNLVLLGIVFVALMSPVILRLLTNPEAVLGRSTEVNRGTGFNLSADSVNGIIMQFFARGDINPQYNVEQVPLLPRSFAWLFLIGLAALVARFRQPSSALVASLLVLCTFPVIAGSEIPHGLRIMGEFAVFPLVIGLGVALILVIVQQIIKMAGARYIASLRTVSYAAALLVLVFITGWDASFAHRTYSAYWDKAEGYEHTWRIFGRVLPIWEWFFRPDRRDFALWLAAQQTPMLVPVDELAEQTTRAWLLTAYPNVIARGDGALIPTGTRLVVPWSLELDGLRSQTREYALLDNHTITLLPPFSAATHAALLEGIEQGERLARSDGVLDTMGYVKGLPPNVQIAFEPRASGDAALAVFGDELQAAGWHGPDTLPNSGTVTYTLDWQALRRLGHDYSVFLQLQTQDYQRLAGDEGLVLRWLFPSTLWHISDVVPDVHSFELPDDLPPGAYRLVAGVYVSTFVDERLPATAGLDTTLGTAATIGWVKVPQPEMPSVQETVTIDATLAEMFALRGASAVRQDDGQLHLTLLWESLVNRPNLDATIFVHVVNQNGEMIAQQDARPWGGQYPTFIWDEGERVQTEYTLDIGGADLDDLSLRVGMYTFPDLTRLPVVQDGEDAPDGFVTIAPLASTVQS